jgi:hypothetical protein
MAIRLYCANCGKAGAYQMDEDSGYYRFVRSCICEPAFIQNPWTDARNANRTVQGRSARKIIAEIFDRGCRTVEEMKNK